MATVRNSRAPTVRKDGVLTRHELAIRLLVKSDPDIHRNGFKAAMRALAEETDCDELPPENFLPDAYKLDRATSEILIYEVEDSHPVPVTKMRKFADFWFWWDSEGGHDWLPRLLIVDRYANPAGEIDLMNLWHSLEPHEGYA